MIVGTTPTFIIRLKEDLDMAEAAHIYVTLTQGNISVMKSDDDLSIDGASVSVYFTQEDTLKFIPMCSAMLQMNWTYTDLETGEASLRACTNEIPIRVKRNGIMEVIA